MNYEESMSGIDQVFEALLSQATEPKRVVVDEMDDSLRKQSTAEDMLAQLMSGQNPASQQRVRAAELYDSPRATEDNDYSGYNPSPFG